MGLIDSLREGISDLDVTKTLVDDMTRGGGRFKPVDTFVAPKEFSAVFTDLKFNPTAMRIDPSDPVITSHELGHLNDFTKNRFNRFIYSKLLDKPILNNLSTLLMERNANKQSWDILSKAYKDNPDILDAFKKLRTQALTPAYKTYLISNGIPLAGAVGTGVLGAWLLSKVMKDGDYEDALANVDPSKKEEARKKIKRINSIVGAVAGGGAGVLLGNRVGKEIGKGLLPKAFENFRNTVHSDSYLAGLKDLADKILKAKEKASSK